MRHNQLSVRQQRLVLPHPPRAEAGRTQERGHAPRCGPDRGAWDIPVNEQHFNASVHFTDAGSEAMAARVSAALISASDFERLVSERFGQ